MRECDLQGEEEEMAFDLLTDLSQVSLHGGVFQPRIIR